MKTLRVILACFFFLLVVGGVWRYFWSNTHPDGNEVELPLLSKIKSLAHKSTDGITWDMPAKDWENNKEEDTNPSIENDNKGIPFSALSKEYTKGKLAPEDLSDLLQGWFIEGPKNAEIIIIQYCDFTNKYCKQANKENTLNVYMEAFPDQVQALIKQYPTSMEDAETLPHRALLCVLDRWTQKQYTAFSDYLYQQSTPSMDDLLKATKDMGIDDLASCLDESNSTLYLQQEINLAKKLFAISALPTYIFLDKDSGERVKVPGLYEDKEVLPVLSYFLDK